MPVIGQHGRAPGCSWLMIWADPDLNRGVDLVVVVGGGHLGVYVSLLKAAQGVGYTLSSSFALARHICVSLRRNSPFTSPWVRLVISCIKYSNGLAMLYQRCNMPQRLWKHAYNIKHSNMKREMGKKKEMAAWIALMQQNPITGTEERRAYKPQRWKMPSAVWQLWWGFTVEVYSIRTQKWAKPVAFQPYSPQHFRKQILLTPNTDTKKCPLFTLKYVIMWLNAFAVFICVTCLILLQLTALKSIQNNSPRHEDIFVFLFSFLFFFLVWDPARAGHTWSLFLANIASAFSLQGAYPSILPSLVDFDAPLSARVVRVALHTLSACWQNRREEACKNKWGVD